MDRAPRPRGAGTHIYQPPRDPPKWCPVSHTGYMWFPWLSSPSAAPPPTLWAVAPPIRRPGLKAYGYIQFDLLAAKFYEADKLFREDKAKRGFVTDAIRKLAEMAGLL